MESTCIWFCVHFYWIKKERAYHYFLTMLNNSCSLWSPNIIKDSFEVAVVSAKSFQTSLLLALTFILISACGFNNKILVLRWNIKKMNKSDSHAECVLLWHTFGTPLAHLWHTFGTPLAHLWHTFGTPLAHLWNTFGTPLAHLPISKVEQYWLMVMKMFHRIRN